MFPTRSNCTSISNECLFILDFLALEGCYTLNSLLDKNYPVHMNITYSHNLKLEDLLDFIQNLKNIKYIRNISYEDTYEKSDNINNEEIYYITRKGGDIWSKERMPIWDRFCVDSSYKD